MSRLTGFHHVAITVPVTLAQTIGNYYVETSTEGFFWRETKNPCCACVPELNDTVAIRIDHGIRNILNECAGEPSEFMII